MSIREIIKHCEQKLPLSGSTIFAVAFLDPLKLTAIDITDPSCEYGPLPDNVYLVHFIKINGHWRFDKITKQP